MKFLGKYINKLKTKNYYLYKSIRRPILSHLSINDESIIFDINKISKYKSYPHLLSKYIYKDIFIDEKEKLSDFIDLDIKIDYNRYKEFDIDIEGFEDELNSIILPNKRLFYDNDYNNKIVYNFEAFRGKNYNLLNNFILKYKDCLEDIDCEDSINHFIKEDNFEQLLSILLEKYYIYFDNKMNTKYKKNKKYEELDIFTKLIIDNYNNSKNELIKIIINDEKEKEEKEGKSWKKMIFFEIIINIYFNLLKIIKYLTDNYISGEILLYDIIVNMPDMYNISIYSKLFFKSNKEYKLKNLLSIFETFEKKLFPFILLHVYDKYKAEIFDENKENIINYFEINKDKIEETQFTKRQFIDALRKFISRNLTSSDKDNEFKNKNDDGEDIPADRPLINYLNKNDLWPLNIYYDKDKIEEGLNKLKQNNLLVKHTLNLYTILSGISFDNTGNIEKITQKKLELDESEKEYNYYIDISYFNNKNPLEIDFSKLFQSIYCLYREINNFNKYCKIYNLGNIYIDYIQNDDDDTDIFLLALSNSNNGLYHSEWKLELDIFGVKFTSEKTDSTIYNNESLADIQNITCLNILCRNDRIFIIIFGTNNAKLKIIRLDSNNNNVELIQELALKEDSGCINSILEFNQNKTIIISDEKHILVFEKNEDDDNYKTYTEKKNIDTGNKTYIIKVDEHNLCAFIYPNIIKFYNIDNYQFKETVVNEINSDINCNNQKQFKMMNVVGKNDNVLAVCSSEHSVYIIDINEKKLIKNCLFEGYNDNFVSVLKFYDDYVLLLDSNNNLILTQVQFKEEKVNDLKFIALIKKLNSDCNMICYLLFEICYFYFDGKDMYMVNNSLEDYKENINVEIDVEENHEFSESEDIYEEKDSDEEL